MTPPGHLLVEKPFAGRVYMTLWLVFLPGCFPENTQAWHSHAWRGAGHFLVPKVDFEGYVIL